MDGRLDPSLRLRSVPIYGVVYVSDLSNNNGAADAIDFGAMAAGGITGTILKVSEDVGFLDPRFPVWAPRARAAGLVVAGYHFANPASSAAAQVGNFERGIANGGGVAFRVADVETDPGGAEVFAEAFCPAALVRLLYSGAYMAGADLSKPIPGVEWWLAAYQSTRPKPPWGTEAGWQFTSTTHVPGVPGLADLSIFDPAAWADLTGGTMFGPNDVVDAFTPPQGHPDFGSSWQLQWNGGVRTQAGTKFYGSYFSLPPQQGTRNFTAIEARPNGQPGYVIFGQDGSYYTLGPISATQAEAVDHLGHREVFDLPL